MSISEAISQSIDMYLLICLSVDRQTTKYMIGKLWIALDPPCLFLQSSFAVVLLVGMLVFFLRSPCILEDFFVVTCSMCGM